MNETNEGLMGHETGWIGGSVWGELLRLSWWCWTWPHLKSTKFVKYKSSDEPIMCLEFNRKCWEIDWTRTKWSWLDLNTYCIWYVYLITNVTCKPLWCNFGSLKPFTLTVHSPSSSQVYILSKFCSSSDQWDCQPGWLLFRFVSSSPRTFMITLFNCMVVFHSMFSIWHICTSSFLLSWEEA